MKKLLLFIAGVFLAALIILVVFADLVAKTVVEKAIEGALPGSRVSVAGCSFPSVGEVHFSGIAIERSGVYSVFVNEADVSYRGRPALRLTDVNAELKLPKSTAKSVTAFLPKGSAVPSKPFFGRVELERSSVKVLTRDVSFNGSISFSADLDTRELVAIDLRIFSLDAVGVKIKDAAIIASRETGSIAAEEVCYGRMLLAGITGKARLIGKTLTAEDIKGKVFDGTVTGKLQLLLSSAPKYAASLTAQGLSMTEVVKDLKVSDKVDMTGSVGGVMNIVGLGRSVTEITGSFLSDASGGTLVVKDENFFRAIAERTKQPLDIIKGSFKEYNFKEGKVELISEGSDLVMMLYLEGDQGKRDVRVTVHGFNDQGEGI